MNLLNYHMLAVYSLIDCASCHITYPRHESPFPMDLLKCDCCGKKYVPEVLLSTTEPPQELQLIGNPVLIEAHGK